MAVGSKLAEPDYERGFPAHAREAPGENRRSPRGVNGATDEHGAARRLIMREHVGATYYGGPPSSWLFV